MLLVLTTNWVTSEIGLVHRQSAWGSSRKQNRSQKPEGKSRGSELSTKIYAVVDVLSNPVCLLLTAGRTSECGEPLALIKGFSSDDVLFDRTVLSEAEAFPSNCDILYP